MIDLDRLDLLFVIWAFLFQIVLIIHFTLRKWHFDLTLRYGWIVYALGIPAAILSVILLFGGKSWFFWLGGFICLLWGIYGYSVEYVKEIQWRNPVRWSIFGPYIFLYLLTIMFYWWPLGLVNRFMWFAYAILFIISTFLNVTSHRNPRNRIKPV